MHTTTNCLNCGAALAKTENFCGHCGQSTHVHRVNIAHLAHETVHFFTHADKGIFYLIRMLAIRPGTVIREYLAGKRKKYFNPLNFFLIVIGLFVFAQSTFKPLVYRDMTSIKKEIMKIPDPVVRERRLAKLERAESAGVFMAKYSNYINMAVTPVVSLIFFLFFYRAGYNYAEHLTANLYLSGFNALMYIFIITPYLLLTKGTPIYFIGVFVFLLWEAVYRAIGYWQLLKRKGFKSFLYPIFVSFLTVIWWYFLSTTLMRMYIEKGF